MIYIKLIFLFFKILFNINKYKYFLQKEDGIGRSWTLYKRPIFTQKLNMKKENIPETKAHEFIYHAFESLEAKDPETFKKEMFDNIILGIIWYSNIEKKEENNEEQLDSSTSRKDSDL
jgi:hypothetical protein